MEHVQVKIWFQNHRYKTKKAQKDQSHVEQRAAAAADLASTADRLASTSPRRVTATPLLIKNGKKSSSTEHIDDESVDWHARRPPTHDDDVPVLPSDMSLPPLLSYRSGSQSLAADLKPADAVGYHRSSTYVPAIHSSMFLQPSASSSSSGPGMDEYRSKLQQQQQQQQPGLTRPYSPSPPGYSPSSPFITDSSLASLLYVPRDSNATQAAPQRYHHPHHHHYPAVSSIGSRTFDRSVASPLGYLPMSGLRTW